jgi:hypothetical protein
MKTTFEIKKNNISKARFVSIHNFYQLFFHKLSIITNNKQLSIGKFKDEMVNICLILFKISYDKSQKILIKQTLHTSNDKLCLSFFSSGIIDILVSLFEHLL